MLSSTFFYWRQIVCKKLRDVFSVVRNMYTKEFFFQLIQFSTSPKSKQIVKADVFLLESKITRNYNFSHKKDIIFS